MHRTEEIIREATALPVEERALVVDSLLRSLNQPTAPVEQEWIALARHRLAELRAGSVPAVPGDKVFANIRERLA